MVLVGVITILLLAEILYNPRLEKIDGATFISYGILERKYFRLWKK